VTCTKRSFINRREAKAMLHSAQERNVAHRAECRTYKCDSCRLYHLTSQPLDEYLEQKAKEDLLNPN
jgi:ferredoxin